MVDKTSKNSLKRIDSDKIIGRSQDDFDDFFLVLAVIFNDLRWILSLYSDFIERNKKPENSEISISAGEYYGTNVQFIKLLAGHINELLLFLKEYEKLYKTAKFGMLLKQMPSDFHKQWNQILEAAFDRDNKDKKSLSYKLMLIRNNIAFHYYQSAKILRDAFNEFFSDKTRSGADFAYYVLGKNMESTRFFYADAAVTHFLMKTSSKGAKLFTDNTAAYIDFQKENIELINSVNHVLGNLLTEYIRYKQSGRFKNK